MITLHTPETLAVFQKMQDEIEQKSINQLTYALHRIATVDMIKWDADTEEEFQREFLPWAQQIARDALRDQSKREVAESADEKPDGQAENDKTQAPV